MQECMNIELFYQLWLITLEALGEEVTSGFLFASLKCGCPGLVSLGHWAKCKWSNQTGQTVRLKRLFFFFFHFSCHLSHLLTIFFQVNINFQVNIKLSSADECCLPNKGHSLFSSPVCFIMLWIHLVDRNVLSFLKGSVWLKGGVPDLMHESWNCRDIWWGSSLLVSVQFWAQMESTGLYRYLKCSIQDRSVFYSNLLWNLHIWKPKAVIQLFLCFHFPHLFCIPVQCSSSPVIKLL